MGREETYTWVTIPGVGLALEITHGFGGPSNHHQHECAPSATTIDGTHQSEESLSAEATSTFRMYFLEYLAQQNALDVRTENIDPRNAFGKRLPGAYRARHYYTREVPGVREPTIVSTVSDELTYPPPSNEISSGKIKFPIIFPGGSVLDENGTVHDVTHVAKGHYNHRGVLEWKHIERLTQVDSNAP